MADTFKKRLSEQEEKLKDTNKQVESVSAENATLKDKARNLERQQAFNSAVLKHAMGEYDAALAAFEAIKERSARKV